MSEMVCIRTSGEAEVLAPEIVRNRRLAARVAELEDALHRIVSINEGPDHPDQIAYVTNIAVEALQKSGGSR